MKLIIKQYLSLLKESGELDIILPDLLLSMNIEPISRAQVGVRQFGVDIAAVGNDENGRKCFFLFVVKQGDVGRVDWNGSTQAIRQSMDEIMEVYIPNHIEPKYRKLLKKVVVCTGGERKQEVDANWTGYVNKYSSDGVLEFEFWGGDKLSLLIENFLFSEKIIPQEFQSKFRKALALLGDPDYRLTDYYSVLSKILLESDFGDTKKKSSQDRILKALRTINISQNILFAWARAEGNLKPAIYGGERALLLSWELIRRHNLFKNKKIISGFYEIYVSLYRIYGEYFNKIRNHCHVKNGLTGYGHHSIHECLNIFEHLGFLSTAGLLYLYHGASVKNEELLDSARTIGWTVIALLNNHPMTMSPCYDNHIIEIGQTILLLSALSESHFVNGWINGIMNMIVFAYHNMHRYFPIDSDSFDDLVALNVSHTKTREELFGMSTLIPTLAHFSITLNLDSTYQSIQELSAKHFPNCTFQIWYPDRDTDGALYIQNAARTGAVDAPLALDPSIEEMRARIQKVQKNTIRFDDVSAVKYGFPILPLIASRHFRTPILPLYFQKDF